MNRDHFIEGLREQYAEELQEAYRECLSNGGKIVDFTALKGRVERLEKNAKVEGLTESDFSDLVNTTLPEAHAKLGRRQAA
ncbi:MAG: hypothetical protein IT285_14720 [Bdellovibrionales bacterium]|nr:hypothetical protein [Bdellovibrionales bacterium]